MNITCPFCLQQLQKHQTSKNNFAINQNRLFCATRWCQIDLMPRFSFYYGKDINSPSMICINSDNFYIQISYTNNKTIIGQVNNSSGIIENSIVLPKSFIFNEDDPEETIQKIRTMVTFS